MNYDHFKTIIGILSNGIRSSFAILANQSYNYDTKMLDSLDNRLSHSRAVSVPIFARNYNSILLITYGKFKFLNLLATNY